MKYFSMFSGIGGFEYGIEKATKGEWKCVGFSEIDKYAVQTYRKHYPSHVNWGDATKIKSIDLPDFDLLIGGFPCQAFSVAGKRRGFEDTRGTLFFEIARILKDKKPSVVLLENVKGLLNHEKGKTFSVILQTLEELRYSVEWMVLNSKFFGVPQNRERVFIIGYLGGKSRREILPFREGNGKSDDLEQETGTRRQGMENEVASAIRNNNKWSDSMIIHNIYGGFKEDKPREFTKYSPTIRTPKGGGHIPMVAQSLQTDGQLREGTSWNTDKPQSARNIRKLTPVECERLQGFPDGWTEGVSDTQRYKQLGNAITTNVVEAIIRKLSK